VVNGDAQLACVVLDEAPCSTGSLRVDDPTGPLQVASTGRLDVGGTAMIMGGIDNAGVVSVLGGGTLVFDRNIDFVGSVPLLDNRNLVQVQAGGLLLVTGSASPGFLGGSELHNRAAAAMLWPPSTSRTASCLNSSV
jgi:hypothetical protein